MWPEGKLSITEVTKRPLTAATLFKNSMISLVENLACKVRKGGKWRNKTTKDVFFVFSLSEKAEQEKSFSEIGQTLWDAAIAATNNNFLSASADCSVDKTAYYSFPRIHDAFKLLSLAEQPFQIQQYR